MFLGLRTAGYYTPDLALHPVQEVGGGIKIAVVRDPFGNALGIIENPHFQFVERRTD